MPGTFAVNYTIISVYSNSESNTGTLLCFISNKCFKCTNFIEYEVFLTFPKQNSSDKSFLVMFTKASQFISTCQIIKTEARVNKGHKYNWDGHKTKLNPVSNEIN